MGILLTIIFSIFFLVLFPLGEFARVDLPNNIAVTGIDIGVVTILLAGVVLYFKRKKYTFFLLKPIAIFLSVCLISLLVNFSHVQQNEFFVALLYLLRFAAYISIYFIVTSVSSVMKKKILILMIFSGALLVLGGYIQFFFYPSLRNLYYLGWDIHLYRMFSSFFDPNFFGAFLVLYVLFLLPFVLTKSVQKNKMHFIGLLIFLLGTFIALMLTYSRSAYIMCAIGVITFFILQKPSKNIIYGALIIFIIIIVSYFGFTKYSEGTNLLRVNSSKARIATSEKAVIIFQKNPILGVGFNAYRYAQIRYNFVKPNQSEIIADHAGAGTDNSFLFVLATTGIIGLFAYLYLLYRIFLLGKHRLKKSILSSVIIASLCAVCINAFFINSLFYPFIMIWLWVLIGLEEIVDKDFLIA